MDTSTTSITRKVWSPSTIGWTTFLTGFPGGFILAAINWYRMGLKRKAVFHAIFGSLFSFLFLFTYQYFDDYDFLFGNELTLYILRVIIALGIIFVITVYLHKSTEKDILQLDKAGEKVEIAKTWTAVGIALLLNLGFGSLKTISYRTIIQTQLANRQDHVYCELLKAGMSFSEVSSSLQEVGEHTQATFVELPKEITSKDVIDFRIVFFHDSNIELRDHLWLGLGYDTNNELVWISKLTPNGYKPIACPWTFQESLSFR